MIFNSLLHDHRPKSIAQCMGADGLDINKLSSYMSYRADEGRQLIASALRNDTQRGTSLRRRGIVFLIYGDFHLQL